MKLHNLKPAKGSVKKRKRLGRGVGSGKGRTSTRGHKGAKSRSGYSQKRAFEGGQMPLQMRLPKRGFKNTHKRYKTNRSSNLKSFNLAQLEFYSTKHSLKEVTPSILKELGIMTKPFKVLASGELNNSLEVTAERFSASARKAIEAAGGKTFLQFSLSQLQGIALAEDTDKVNLELIRKYFDHVGENDCIHAVVDGGISHKLNLEVHKISEDAKAQLDAHGGAVSLV